MSNKIVCSLPVEIDKKLAAAMSVSAAYMNNLRTAYASLYGKELTSIREAVKFRNELNSADRTNPFAVTSKGKASILHRTLTAWYKNAGQVDDLTAFIRNYFDEKGLLSKVEIDENSEPVPHKTPDGKVFFLDRQGKLLVSADDFIKTYKEAYLWDNCLGSSRTTFRSEIYHKSSDTTYDVVADGSGEIHFFSQKTGQEMFIQDDDTTVKTRTELLANLFMANRLAVPVEYEGQKYIVTKDKVIIAIPSAEIMSLNDDTQKKHDAINKIAAVKFKEMKGEASAAEIMEAKNTENPIEAMLSQYDKVRDMLVDAKKLLNLTSEQFDALSDEEKQEMLREAQKQVKDLLVAFGNYDARKNRNKFFVKFQDMDITEDQSGKMSTVFEVRSTGLDDEEAELFTMLLMDMGHENTGTVRIDDKEFTPSYRKLRYEQWLSENRESGDNGGIYYIIQQAYENLTGEKISEELKRKTEQYHLFSEGDYPGERKTKKGLIKITQTASGLWEKVARAIGMKVTVHAPKQLDEAVEKECVEKVQKANETLQRLKDFPFPVLSEDSAKVNTWKNQALMRRWLTVKEADGIFAVAEMTIDLQTGKPTVVDHSAWNIQMFLDDESKKGKPIYVYNTTEAKNRRDKTNLWYVYDWDQKKFVPYTQGVPVFTQNPACIGISTLKTDNQKWSTPGERAIRDVFTKTFGYEIGRNKAIKYKPDYKIKPFTLDPSDPRQRYKLAFRPDQRDRLATSVARKFDFQIQTASVTAEESIADALNKLKIVPEDKRTLKVQRQIVELEKRLAAIQNPDTRTIATVKEVGVAALKQKVFDTIKADFEDDSTFANEENPEYKRQLYQKVLDNFDMLFQDTVSEIERISKVIISGNAVNVSSAEAQSEEMELDDDTEGERASNLITGQKARQTNPITSLSKIVKEFLGTLMVDGKVDELGETIYHDGDYIFSVLLNELSGLSDDAKEFFDKETNTFPALEKIKSKYSWVEPLIDRLWELADEENYDIISQLYRGIRQDFISYWVQSGNKSINVNRTIASETAISDLLAKYEHGQVLDTEFGVYNEDSTLNKENTKKLRDAISKVEDIINKFQNAVSVSDEEGQQMFNDISRLAARIFRGLGIDTTEGPVLTLVQMNGGLDKIKDMLLVAKNITGKIIYPGKDSISDGDHYVSFFQSQFDELVPYISLVSEISHIKVVRISGKPYYSYSAPNYLDTIIKQLSEPDSEKRREFMKKRFMQYHWFANPVFDENNNIDEELTTWKSEWLRLLFDDSDESMRIRKMYTTAELKEIDGVPYSQWTKLQTTEALLRQYWQMETGDTSTTKDFAFYAVPMLSDSPVCKFVRFKKYTGVTSDDMKTLMIPRFRELVKQELDRMEVVRKRQTAVGVEKIDHFDENGLKFNFMPELNTFKFADGNTLLTALDRIPKRDNMTEAEQKYYDDTTNGLIDDAVRQVMDALFEQFYNEDIVPYKQELKSHIGVHAANRKDLEEYFWNQTYASSQIILTTATDVAFAKNATDFQKRYKEVYASGLRMNTQSKYGKETQNVIYLADAYRTSPVYNSVKMVLDKAVSEGRMNSKDAEWILKNYKGICIADGQAYRTVKSFRSILDMMGKWTPQMEATFNRIQKGEFDMTDYWTVWNTIKPFAFDNVEQYTGLSEEEGGSRMLVPTQLKDSEFVMMAMYSLFASSVGSSPQMRALDRYMTEHDIDVAVMQSGVKTGGQGAIDIYSPSIKSLVEWGAKHEADLRNLTEGFLRQMTKNAKDNESKKQNVQIVRDLIKKHGKEFITDFMLLANTPGSIVDFTKKYQIKNSDFTYFTEYFAETPYVKHMYKAVQNALDNTTITQADYNRIVDKDWVLSEEQVTQALDKALTKEPGNPNIPMLDWTQHKVSDNGEIMLDDEGNPIVQGTKRFNPQVMHQIKTAAFMTAQATPEHLFDVDATFGSQLRNLIIADLPDVDAQGNKVYYTVHGKRFTKNELKTRFKNLVIENLMDDFGDVLETFEDGDVTKLRERLLHMMQQNSKYGEDVIEALEVEDVKDASGQVVYREDGKPKKKFALSLAHPATLNAIQDLVNSMWKNAVHKQKINGAACILVSNFGYTNELSMLHDNEGRLIGAECFLPAHSRKFFEGAIDEKTGKLDMDKIPADLRRMIAYRIPTEHKYSMLPLYVKGFLPQENGSVIMLPMETIPNSGEDFDVDKKFMMIPNFDTVYKYDMRAAREAFNREVAEGSVKLQEIFDTVEVTDEQLDNMTEAEIAQLLFKDVSSVTYNQHEILNRNFAKWFRQHKHDYINSIEYRKIDYDPDLDPSEFGKTPKGKISKSLAKKQRDNMLIDMCYSILTNRMTTDQIYHPGNYATVKKFAYINRIMNDEKLLRQYMEDKGFGPADVVEAAKALLDEDSKVIIDLAKNQSINPLTPHTYIYFQKQNMTGANLIGLYANNTAMQNKLQEMEIGLKPEFSHIEINGRRIASVTGVFTTGYTDEALADNSRVKRGAGQRISYNCAEPQAASVDNGKDPCLADLGQNMTTAGVYGAMLRMGFTNEEAALFFCLPAVQDSIRHVETFKETKGFIKHMGDHTKELYETRIQDGDSAAIIENVARTPLDSFMLAEIKANQEDLSHITYNDRTGYTITEYTDKFGRHRTDGDILRTFTMQRKALLTFNDVLKIADAVKSISQPLKHDSPSNPIAITAAGVMSQIRAIDVLRDKIKEQDSSSKKKEQFPLDSERVDEVIIKNRLFANVDIHNPAELRQVLRNSPLSTVQAFYSLGIELPMTVMQDMIPTMSVPVQRMFHTLASFAAKKNFDALKEKKNTTGDFIIKDIITYALSKTAFFGDEENATMEDKREYYIHHFPRKLIDTIKLNPDIAALPFFGGLRIEKGKLVFSASTQKSQAVKQKLRRDIEGLMYSDNPEAVKIIEDLLKYCYYVEEFSFGPDRLTPLLSPSLFESIPGYNNALENIDTMLNDSDEFDNFMMQLIRQKGTTFLPSFKESSFQKHVSDPNLLVINMPGNNAPRYLWTVQTNDEQHKVVYLELDSVSETQAVYKKLDAFSITEHATSRYNANKSADEMAKWTVDIERMKELEKVYASPARKQEKVLGSTRQQSAKTIADNKAANANTGLSQQDVQNAELASSLNENAAADNEAQVTEYAAGFQESDSLTLTSEQEMEMDFVMNNYSENDYTAEQTAETEGRGAVASYLESDEPYAVNIPADPTLNFGFDFDIDFVDEGKSDPRNADDQNCTQLK